MCDEFKPLGPLVWTCFLCQIYEEHNNSFQISKLVVA